MKSLNQAPTAINKASTDTVLWEFSKEGKMSSHFGKNRERLQRVDIWVETKDG